MSSCLRVSLSVSPDDQRATLCRGDLDAEVLQAQQVAGGQLVRLWGRGGGGAAMAAATLRRLLQADAFSALHHGLQL